VTRQGTGAQDPDPTEHVRDDHVAEDLAPDLSGDLGVSSERVDPTGGVQGTGTTGPTQGRTAAATPTYPGEEVPTPRTTVPGVPDDELTENPADVPSHELDPERNPGHSHG
jgi:hypothetical protein